MVDSIGTRLQLCSNLGLGLQLGSANSPSISAPIEESTYEAQNQYFLAGHPLFPSAVHDCCENSHSEPWSGGQDRIGQTANELRACANLSSFCRKRRQLSALHFGANDSYIAINNGVSEPKSTLHFAFENANPTASLEGIEPLPGVINYYTGQDSRNWR